MICAPSVGSFHSSSSEILRSLEQDKMRESSRKRPLRAEDGLHSSSSASDLDQQQQHHQDDVDTLGDATIAWYGSNEATVVLGATPLCLLGRGRIRLISGTVSLHGFCLTDEFRDFESPIYASWLTIVAEEHGKKGGEVAKVAVESTRRVAGVLVPTFEIKLATEPHSRPTVIPRRWTESLDSILQEQLCRQLENEKASQRKRPTAFTRLLEKESSSEKLAAKEMEQAALGFKVVVVGAKNVGKSTCLRYAINRHLSMCSEVAVLDGDLGQPELSPPGMVTLTRLRQPIFSQPHLHLVTNEDNASAAAPRHEMAYWFGASTSQGDPEKYVSSLTKLVRYYHEKLLPQKPTLPLLINLDGWVKGLGMQILEAILLQIQPTHVIQILGDLNSKVFELSLPDEIHLHICHAYHVIPPEEQQRKTKMSTPTSDSESKETCALVDRQHDTGRVTSLSDIASLPTIPSSIPASALRTLRFVSYFLDDISIWDRIRFGQKELIVDINCVIAKRFASQKPYIVPFEAITVDFSSDEFRRDIRTPERILDSLNGSIVGLCCRTGKSDDEFDCCVGLGIVRSIDREQQLFYILTPVDQKVLPQVDTIVKGQLPLPMECYFRGSMEDSFLYQTIELKAHDIPGSEPMRSRNTLFRKGN